MDAQTVGTNGAPFGYSNVSNEDVREFQRLAYKIIYENDFGDELNLDEKMSAGLIGVANGLATFDPSRGVTRSHWVAWNVKKSIREETRQSCRQLWYAKNKKRQKAIYKIVKRREENETSSLALKLRDADEGKKKALLNAVLNFLNDDERLYVQRLVFESKTQQELAREKGVSQSWVSRVWNRTIEKIKENAGELEEWL